MHEYIRKIKSKDENSRKRIFLFTMIVLMVIVSSIWFYSLNDRFGKHRHDKIVQKEGEEELKPFTLFKNSMKETYRNINASVGSIDLSKIRENNEDPDKQIDLIVIDKETE